MGMDHIVWPISLHIAEIYGAVLMTEHLSHKLNIHLELSQENKFWVSDHLLALTIFITIIKQITYAIIFFSVFFSYLDKLEIKRPVSKLVDIINGHAFK